MFGLKKRQRRTETDQELLQRIREQHHDPALIGELFASYTHLVYGVCLKYLEDTEDASDAVMSIYEKLCQEMSRHEINNFVPWLYVITKNFCLMQLRSRKAQSERHALWEKDQLFFMENPEALHPIDEEDIKEQQLHKCIEQLKNEQKECIQLFYFENKCYLEIAQQLGLEEKNVKSYLQNAKRNLSICLEKTNSHE